MGQGGQPSATIIDPRLGIFLGQFTYLVTAAQDSSLADGAYAGL